MSVIPKISIDSLNHTPNLPLTAKTKADLRNTQFPAPLPIDQKVSISAIEPDAVFYGKHLPGLPAAITRVGNEPARNAALADPDLQEVATAPALALRTLSPKPMPPDRISASIIEQRNASHALNQTPFEREALDPSIAYVPENDAKGSVDEMFAEEMILEEALCLGRTHLNVHQISTTKSYRVAEAC